MVMSLFQKVTLVTCALVCVALLLPKLLFSSRGRKDAAAAAKDGTGHLPPMMHRQLAPERAAGSGFSRAHNTEAIARAKGAGPGAGMSGKSNLAGQIIPVYGFGILLYILYILFKITSKGSSKPTENRFPSVRSENKKRKITDFELAQLQDKLQETELMMENIVSNVHHSPDRVKGVMADQEESLLQQLTEITRVMQEGKMVDDVAPQKKNQEDWDGSADYPEEPHQFWKHSHCCCQHHSPHTETDAERTRADGADLENIREDAAGGEKVEGEDDGGKESEPTAASEETEGDLRGRERLDEHREGGATVGVGGVTVGVGGATVDVGGVMVDMGGANEEQVSGVLQELEISLQVTSVMEQEKVEEPKEAETSSVRRRNRRRRGKKNSQA